MRGRILPAPPPGVTVPAWSILAFWGVILAAAGVTVLVRGRVRRWRLVRAAMRGLDAELERELTA